MREIRTHGSTGRGSETGRKVPRRSPTLPGGRLDEPVVAKDGRPTVRSNRLFSGHPAGNSAAPDLQCITASRPVGP